MRRFFGFLLLLSCAVPIGTSIAGCSKTTPVEFCNGGDSGPVIGQTKSVSLSPNFATYGESVNYGQIGTSLSVSAVDCKGNAVSVRNFVFATSDMSFADINPASGQVCGGTFNRNTGGGIPDYTICTAPVNPPASTVAYVTATGDGVVSNPIAVFVHPIATAIVIGSPTPQASCTTALQNPLTSDLSSNCCPGFMQTVTAPAYNPNVCISQNQNSQLTARVYASLNGTTLPSENITCRAGHINYSAQNSSIFTIDQNGVATAQQPGSSIITANLTNSSSGGASGFFATCPPVSITISSPLPPVNGAINVNVNNSVPFSTSAVDANGVTLTNLQLEFISTTPTTITAGNATISSAFPGSATITAVCQPPSCNPAPFSQIGLLLPAAPLTTGGANGPPSANGKPLTSNGLVVTASGTNATQLYIGSTQSQYIFPVDFSTNQTGSLVRLPYLPNSMVISQDGNTIYLGSTIGLMTYSPSSNVASAANVAVPGTVLAVAPDNSVVVVTDPARQTVSLVSGGNVSTTYGGVGLRAQFSPDSQTVYIAAANNTLLVYSRFTGWYSVPTSAQYVDVAVTVPSVGAFFPTNTTLTEGRSYCSASTASASGNPPVVTNAQFPVANSTAARIDRIAATNDGQHLIGATITPTPTLSDIVDNLSTSSPKTATQPGGPNVCTNATAPIVINTAATTTALTGIAANAITGVVPAGNSAIAFVTYTGGSGLLPAYVPAAAGAGTLTNVPLSGGALTAPVAGVFSTDNKTFYVGTSGDNLVHLITVTGTTAADTSTLAPKLPDANGNIVTPNLLVQRPKRAVN